MMLQFEVASGHLCLIDTSRYDPMWGFYRVIKRLPQQRCRIHQYLDPRPESIMDNDRRFKRAY